MSTKTATLFRRLSALAGGPEQAATDRELLRRFVAGRDEPAFAALVGRHGPLVLGVCRRLLARPQDAEDAFQATFLILARKAASVRWQESAAGWLHGVARRVALKARAAALRRAAREQSARPPRAADPVAELAARELYALLDEELARLPENYRGPVLLCCLGRVRGTARRHRLPRGGGAGGRGVALRHIRPGPPGRRAGADGRRPGRRRAGGEEVRPAGPATDGRVRRGGTGD
jgi:RNA polymerase sigma factor (sigma-70 family)